MTQVSTSNCSSPPTYTTKVSTWKKYRINDSWPRLTTNFLNCMFIKAFVRIMLLKKQNNKHMCVRADYDEQDSIICNFCIKTRWPQSLTSLSVEAGKLGAPWHDTAVWAGSWLGGGIWCCNVRKQHVLADTLGQDLKGFDPLPFLVQKKNALHPIFQSYVFVT